ncbi:4'-phosphopantetheinyl transferase family protein [Bacillus cereus]|uniref:4'-phosphopantetheinyl transferase family protein n=1 Tax=Bacillus cereus TaxID=1396 RepID=UPI001879363C|nr:4'-phosphopantetheinyl transferase superfamily protein [Bacillus cereus]MBE7122182.1 4'-phosphopantetheinyl transferase superfamily protein [Bacillus cereus]
MEIYGVLLNYGSEDNIKKVEYLKKYISKQKLNKIDRLKKNEDRMRSIIGDVMVRWAICNKYNLLNENLLFTTNEYGKPFLINNNIKVSFSISHSGSWVVVALSSLEVGIDIEKVKDLNVKIAQQFFTPEENNTLTKLIPEEQLHYFYELWTLKESYVKAIGKGLSVPLDSFSINTNNQYITVSPESPYNFRQYLLQNYKLAVCSLENFFPDYIKVVSLEQLENLKMFCINS